MMKPMHSDDPRVAVVHKVCRYIEENLETPLTLATLSEQAAMSPQHLQRIFKRTTGITPRQYADARRLERLKSRLKKRQTVTTALYEAGYSSSSRLYERSAGQLGMTPATYQRGAPHTAIGYTIVSCCLGRLLLAGTEQGVCAVSLGDCDQDLERFLRDEFPAAKIVQEDARLQEWVQAVVEHVAGERPHLELPVDVQATAFQWRVWQELCKIPYGSTKSYREVAEAIGKPEAARAVARACATNPIAVVVPCHRVIREDGSLSGYRWGIERKKALLEQEKGVE
jgi:AraC family transcriptional regulator, regulatory protein of adaptative response / methylated-DNA-[protein]-cysteine methyltransferase